MKLKKLVSTGLATVMALSMVACGSSGTNENTDTATSEGGEAATVTAENTANADEANTEKSDETLVVALASEPSSMVPTLVGESENESSIICGALLDTLVAQDQTTGEIVPNLATEWDYSSRFVMM